MVTPARSIVAVLGVLALWCGSLACSSQTPTAPTPTPERGTIVSTTPLGQLNAEQARAALAERDIDVPVRNGVEAFRVEYRTIDPQGGQTSATGLVVLPDTDNPRPRVVGYEHGTMSARADAPSVDASGEDRARALMFAASGYAAIAPDYLGLGEGPGFHPYAHAPSEASASVDLLLAARAMAAQRQRELDPEVLVTGFSQGGQAAMAFSRALQEGQAPGFRLAAAAPVSGPFDIQHTELPAAFDGRVKPASAVFYVAYWLTSMNRIYHLYDTPQEAFQEPSASKVEGLLDGTHDMLSIALGLAITPRHLLTPRFVDLATHPTGAVLRAMTDSDNACDWSPKVPVRLYAASGDRDVPYANSEACVRDLHANTNAPVPPSPPSPPSRNDAAPSTPTPTSPGPSGTVPNDSGQQEITLNDLGNLDHTGTARTAMPKILDWFQQLAPPA
ncbi:alpha/beta hydrolase family protein [Nocardia callitridis]|uniref:Lipase family protein n=1 Tax=Nocardia callitridis TaxID=648753 RepID=A0ABP9K5Q8_9NOCA